MGGFEISMQRQRDARKTTCDDELLRWAGQMRDNGIAPGEAAGLVQKKNLFRPQYFKPFFGKRFSKLGDKKRMSASVRLMGSCTRDARYNELVAGIGALGDPFLNLPGFSAADAAIAEVSHTRLQRWADTANEYLSALPLDTTDPATVETIAARAAAVLLPLWPAEQDDFAQQARTELGRIVVPRIERQLQATLNKTSTDDAASLLTLARFLTDNQALIDKLNPSDQNAIVSLYGSRISAFFEASLDEHNRMLTSLEPGREALQSSTAWFASHEALFALFPQISSVNSLYNALVASRRSSFGGVADGLVADVRLLDDRAELDRFLSTYIIALDTEVTESAPVRAAVLTKHNEISAREQAAREQAYRESFFTAYELSLMTKGFGDIQIPDRLQAPDAQGVRFALVRARADRGYVRDTPFSVSGGGGRAIVSVDTPRCSPEGSGYRCQYRAVEEITYSGLGFFSLFLSSREMLEFNRNDLFEMTPDGWRSATVASWLAKRAAALARMQENSRSNDDYWNNWEDTQREAKEYQDQIDLMITM